MKTEETPDKKKEVKLCDPKWKKKLKKKKNSLACMAEWSKQHGSTCKVKYRLLIEPDQPDGSPYILWVERGND